MSDNRNISDIHSYIQQQIIITRAKKLRKKIKKVLATTCLTLNPIEINIYEELLIFLKKENLTLECLFKIDKKYGTTLDYYILYNKEIERLKMTKEQKILEEKRQIEEQKNLEKKLHVEALIEETEKTESPRYFDKFRVDIAGTREMRYEECKKILEKMDVEAQKYIDIYKTVWEFYESKPDLQIKYGKLDPDYFRWKGLNEITVELIKRSELCCRYRYMWDIRNFIIYLEVSVSLSRIDEITSMKAIYGDFLKKQKQILEDICSYGMPTNIFVCVECRRFFG